MMCRWCGDYVHLHLHDVESGDGERVVSRAHDKVEAGRWVIEEGQRRRRSGVYLAEEGRWFAQAQAGHCSKWSWME